MLNQRSRASQLRHSHRGFTLIELLVGLTVGAIVLLTLALSWSLVVRDQVYILSVTALNNDMRSLMQIVTQDARRAWGPAKTDTNLNARLLEIVEYNTDAHCIAFNAHVGGSEIAVERAPRLLWDGGVEPTLIPTGYRLFNDQLDVWAPPRPTSTDTVVLSQYEAFGKCNLASQTEIAGGQTLESPSQNWWLPLLSSGDRGVFVDAFTVSADRSRCLDFGGLEVERVGICDPADDEEHVQVTLLDFVVEGRLELPTGAREFRFVDAVKIRNDWIIGAWK